MINNENLINEAKDNLARTELKLKSLWTEYVSCLEKKDLNKKAKALKDEYYKLYLGYRKDKYWRETINNK